MYIYFTIQYILLWRFSDSDGEFWPLETTHHTDILLRNPCRGWALRAASQAPRCSHSIPWNIWIIILYIFVETPVHLWTHQYICGDTSTFVETSLHLWRHQYICGDTSTFVETPVHLPGMCLLTIGAGQYITPLAVTAWAQLSGSWIWQVTN